MGPNIIRWPCKALLGIKNSRGSAQSRRHHSFYHLWETRFSPLVTDSLRCVCVCPKPPVLDFVTESTNLPHQMERFPYLMDIRHNIPIWWGARAQRAFGKRKAKLGKLLGQNHLSVTLKRRTQTELSEVSWVERPLTSPGSQFDRQQPLAQPAHEIEDIKW